MEIKGFTAHKIIVTKKLSYRELEILKQNNDLTEFVKNKIANEITRELMDNTSSIFTKFNMEDEEICKMEMLFYFLQPCKNNETPIIKLPIP